jgi:Na+-transporting methylmalonyl-CoA/oxaloacetate decarboxylase gamma subunit
VGSVDVIAMFDAGLLTMMLGLGVLVLVVTTTIMLVEFLPGSRQRQRPRPDPRALSAGAAQAVADARARASLASGELRIATPVTGQIIDLSDGRWTDRQMSVDEANAIATHFAETDPQRVAEVISQWIRADLTEEPDTRF